MSFIPNYLIVIPFGISTDLPHRGLFPALLHGHRALPSVVESEQKETADWDICRIYSILTFNTITFQELLQAQLPDASTKALLWG